MWSQASVCLCEIAGYDGMSQKEDMTYSKALIIWWHLKKNNVKTHHLQMRAAPWLKSSPSSEVWIWKSPLWARDFRCRCCRMAWGAERRPPARWGGSFPRRAGKDARRDTAAGRPGEGRRQPGWQGASWMEVPVPAAAGKIKGDEKLEGEDSESRTWLQTRRLCRDARLKTKHFLCFKAARLDQ